MVVGVAWRCKSKRRDRDGPGLRRRRRPPLAASAAAVRAREEVVQGLPSAVYSFRVCTAHALLFPSSSSTPPFGSLLPLPLANSICSSNLRRSSEQAAEERRRVTLSVRTRKERRKTREKRERGTKDNFLVDPNLLSLSTLSCQSRFCSPVLLVKEECPLLPCSQSQSFPLPSRCLKKGGNKWPKAEFSSKVTLSTPIIWIRRKREGGEKLIVRRPLEVQ